jgi:restriction endonuclease S subunit
MNRKLKEIANVHAGLTVRKASRTARTHLYSIIQIRNVSEFGTLELNEMAEAPLEEVPPRFFLGKGDVLFCARGTRTQAAPCVVGVDHVVVGSQFFILRLAGEAVLPEYLAWYINQQPAQRYLNERKSGSHVRMILRDDLLDLPVTVPPLTVQRQILELRRLQVKEQSLLNRLRQRRLDLLSALCVEAAEKLDHLSKGVKS